MLSVDDFCGGLVSVFGKAEFFGDGTRLYAEGPWRREGYDYVLLHGVRVEGPAVIFLDRPDVEAICYDIAYDPDMDNSYGPWRKHDKKRYLAAWVPTPPRITSWARILRD